MARRKKKTKSLWIVIAILLIVWGLRQWPQNNNTSVDEKTERSANTELHKDRTEPRKARPPRDSLTVDEPKIAPGSIHDFDSAKSELKKLFARGRDFYCACSYDFSRKPNVDPSSCGLKSSADRAKRMEWEHVVPASYYGRQFAEWRKGDPSCTGRNKKGRECARRASPVFRQIEGDMYNLVPAVGELNRERGDTRYGEIAGEPREFGACDFERLGEVTEPRPEVRGDIARIYFYMDARYPQYRIVNDMNQKMLEEWAAGDPLDEAERTRLSKIEQVQGNSFFIGRLQMAAKPSQDKARLE